MRFEDELREALRPADPGPRFAERVLARLETANAGVRPSALPAPRAAAHSPGASRWVPLGLAASIAVLTTGGLVFLETQRRVEGERARAQVIAALRLTSGELNEIGRRLSRPAPHTQPAPGDPGPPEERVP